MSKLERLLNLTAVLLDTRRPLSAEELRRRVDGYPPPGVAFHRAFERDKDDLRVLGIPLRVERVPGTDPAVDGYRIDPDEYYLPDPGLEPDELAALHLASLSVRTDALAEPTETLWKLGGGGRPHGEGIDQSLAIVAADPALVPLFQAIVDTRSVGFRYKAEARIVDPWRLDYHRGRWYLTGHDLARGSERNFRLDRIEGDVSAGAPRTHHPPARVVDGPRSPWELGADEPTMAELVVDADHVASAAAQLGSAVSRVDRPDGSARFMVPVVNFDGFRTFLFGLLDHAELVAPAAWRDEVIAWLEQIAGDADPAGQPSGAGS
ncbi:MAG: helix-turn-helix transcriptional regulator [Acidimicrobiales bacterium]